MTYFYRDVRNFHDKFGLDSPNTFQTLEPALYDFRHKFLIEEFTEYVDSYETGDLYTAIDSLIDLIYVACGAALLHGISLKEWDELTESAMKHNTVIVPLFEAAQISANKTEGAPVFLMEQLHSLLTSELKREIDYYAFSHKHSNKVGIQNALSRIYVSCLAGAYAMGISAELFEDLWDDVQRANMAKERALRPEDSKRGSVYDVIKPKGWIAPDGAMIVAKYLGAV